MVNFEDCKSLEERMFYLGSHCMPLPLKPESKNIIYYNLGIETYRRVMEIRNLKSIIDMATSRLEQNDFGSNENFKKLVEDTYYKITDNYNQLKNNILSDESLDTISGSDVTENIIDWVDTNFQLNNLNFKKFYNKYLSMNHGQ